MGVVTIELIKHENVIYAPEFKRSYDIEYHKNLILEEIDEAINEYMGFREELQSREEIEVNNIINLNSGNYHLDCGDYSYYIDISRGEIDEAN